MNEQIMRMLQGGADLQFTPSEVALVNGIWLNSLEKVDQDAPNKITGFFEFQSFIIKDFARKFYEATHIEFREVTIKNVRIGHVLAVHSQSMHSSGILDIQSFDTSKEFIKQGTQKGSYQRPPVTIEEVGIWLDNMAALGISQQEIEDFKSWIQEGTLETKMIIIPGTGPEQDLDMDEQANPTAPEEEEFKF